jgi:hypothetical protein
MAKSGKPKRWELGHCDGCHGLRMVRACEQDGRLRCLSCYASFRDYLKSLKSQTANPYVKPSLPPLPKQPPSLPGQQSLFAIDADEEHYE